MHQLLLTPEKAAGLLAISRSKLYQLLREGRLESVQIGVCRIPHDALSRTSPPFEAHPSRHSGPCDSCRTVWARRRFRRSHVRRRQAAQLDL